MSITMSSHSDRPAGAVKRRYVAPLRQAKAAETRRRVLAAAHELFVSHGYVATTVDDIAAAAGVSRPTVFVSVGGKPELLKQLRDVVLAGDDEPIAMPRRKMFQEVWDAPDAASALRLFARNMRAIYLRAADVEHVLQSAAHVDPELRPLAEQAHVQRRYGCGLLVASLRGKGALRAGLSERAAGDVVFALASPDTFRLLVRQSGWSPRRYQQWLADALPRELLEPTT
jgi:AcrR family transcriptional regulator